VFCYVRWQWSEPELKGIGFKVLIICILNSDACLVCGFFIICPNGPVYVTGRNYFCFSLILYPITTMRKLMNLYQ
jgi:hypothetical protein